MLPGLADRLRRLRFDPQLFKPEFHLQRLGRIAFCLGSAFCLLGGRPLQGGRAVRSRAGFEFFKQARLGGFGCFSAVGECVGLFHQVSLAVKLPPLHCEQ